MLPKAGPKVPPHPEINSDVIQNIYVLSELNRLTTLTVQTVVFEVIYGFFSFASDFY